MAQRTVTGTLSSIVDLVEKEGIQNPAIIIVGEVVTFRDRISLLEAGGKVESYATMA
ncbi:hypothetical protein [Neobacillus niacini]|uniref:hypothetical protein n=1 Tax=Neobacillus niacini TaxID=86668 RepID=UPI000B2AC09B